MTDMTAYRVYLSLRNADEAALACHHRPEVKEYHKQYAINQINEALAHWGLTTTQLPNVTEKVA